MADRRSAAERFRGMAVIRAIGGNNWRRVVLVRLADETQPFARNRSDQPLLLAAVAEGLPGGIDPARQASNPTRSGRARPKR